MFAHVACSLLAAASAVLAGPSDPAVEWRQGSLSDALAEARHSERMVLVYCWADGSERCGQLWQETLGAEASQAALGDFVCFNARHSLPGAPELFEEFGVQTLPTILFLSGSGAAEDLIQGYIPSQAFHDELQRIRHGDSTVSALRTIAEREPAASEAGIDARWRLAGKLQALGDQENHDVLMDSIREADPKGKTETGARIALGDVVSKATFYGASEPGEWQMDSIEEFVQRCKHPQVAFSGWQQLGNMHASRHDVAASLEAFKQAWRLCPEEQRTEWAVRMASWFVDQPEQRNSKERKFALELAKAAASAGAGGKDEPTGDGGEGSHAGSRTFLLARALRLNGKDAKAEHTARRALEEAGEGELREHIVKFLAEQ